MSQKKLVMPDWRGGPAWAGSTSDLVTASHAAGYQAMTRVRETRAYLSLEPGTFLVTTVFASNMPAKEVVSTAE